MSLKQKLAVILGPTAVGKSALAVEIARVFHCEIISADSRQIYRGLDIGTGKVTRREMRGVRHHLLDVASPRRQWNAAQYARHAEHAIRAIARRGKLPILVGGTGFYIDALLGRVTLADVPPDRALRRALAKHSPRELLEELARLDPARAKTVDPHNSRRLIRAIEIARASCDIQSQTPQGRSSDVARGNVPARPQKLRDAKAYDVLFIGLTLPPDELRARIRARLAKRLRRGLIAEVRRLREKDTLSSRRLEELGLEYRYVARFLSGALSREELERVLEQKIYQYSRRQQTYFKRNPDIRWFKPHETAALTNTVRQFIAQ
jgi:tRNA dimethylallyltransferase